MQTKTRKDNRKSYSLKKITTNDLTNQNILALEEKLGSGKKRLGKLPNPKSAKKNYVKKIKFLGLS
jgi:hypothetical protein